MMVTTFAPGPRLRATRIAPPQGLRHAVDRVRRADRVHERGNLAAGLAPDFFAERQVSLRRIVVVELIAVPVPGPAADLGGCVDHGPDQRLGDLMVVARRIRNAGAEGLHGAALLFAEGIRKYDLEAIALAAQTRASEMPVVPTVYSTTVPPG